MDRPEGSQHARRVGRQDHCVVQPSLWAVLLLHRSEEEVGADTISLHHFSNPNQRSVPSKRGLSDRLPLHAGTTSNSTETTALRRSFHTSRRLWTPAIRRPSTSGRMVCTTRPGLWSDGYRLANYDHIHLVKDRRVDGLLKEYPEHSTPWLPVVGCPVTERNADSPSQGRDTVCGPASDFEPLARAVGGKVLGDGRAAGASCS